jgi:hypothetical protein
MNDFTNMLPAPRPLLWPLRSVESADTRIDDLPDRRRRISIRHAELKGVSPEMLAWWFGHVEGEMEYAGAQWPRYLVWHPLDHISYKVVKRTSRDGIAPGTKLHLREAFQRDPRNLLDVTVDVERIDAEMAIISSNVLGMPLLRLANSFEGTATGSLYRTELTIGSSAWIGRFGFNQLVRSRVLAGDMALAWARHHIEEIGNLENFLPALYKTETAPGQMVA